MNQRNAALNAQLIQENEVTENATEIEEVSTLLDGRQQRFVSEHSTCAMCDSDLEIRHDSNRAELKVREEAHCPSCGIRVRSHHHLMH